jgi:transposase InsO family protein
MCVWQRPTTIGSFRGTDAGWELRTRPVTAGASVSAQRGLQPWSRYTSWAFSQRARAAGLDQSLGRVGDSFDNAAVESFWAGMQTEVPDSKAWRTRVELSTAIFDWIEVFYNRVRRNSSLGMLYPDDHEKLPVRASTEERPGGNAPPHWYGQPYQEGANSLLTWLGPRNSVQGKSW